MMSEQTPVEFERVPAHIAIIMDGNGRWARKRGKQRLEGHRAGVENLREVLNACVEFGIQYLTIYAFSTENWARPREEVLGLLNILSEVIDTELEELHANGVQLRHIGQLERLSRPLQKKVRQAIDLTKDNQRLILNIAWNYGGRDEIVHVIQSVLQEGLAPEDITEEVVEEHLYTRGCPDPDLVIRTSGEFRISNFLLWQSAYSEWYFTPVLWPDFGREELRKAIEVFAGRERRFGRTSDQVT